MRSWGSARQKLPFILVSGPGKTFSSDLFSFLFRCCHPGWPAIAPQWEKRNSPCSYSHSSPPTALSCGREGVEPRLPLASACHFLLSRRPSPPASSSHWPVPAATVDGATAAAWRETLSSDGDVGQMDQQHLTAFRVQVSFSFVLVPRWLLFGEDFIITEFQMLWWVFSLFPFVLQHMVRRRGFSTSLSLSPEPRGLLWRPTFLGRGFSAILSSLFPSSPWDSTPLYLVMITVILPVAVSFFSKLLFFHLYVLAFISAHWWKGSS